MSCRKVAAVLEAFVDGELAADHVVDVEQHLLDCSTCRERVKVSRALHVSLQRAVRSAAPVTPSFQARIASALAAEAEREATGDLPPDALEHRRMLGGRSLGLFAAAAAATLWAASANKPTKQALQYAQGSVTSNTAEGFIEELVNHYMAARSPEVTEPSLLHQFEPDVGVPVRVPSLRDYGGQWEGGSLIPVSNQNAASLRYRVGGHRVTLYVYDSSRLPIETRLLPRVVRNEPVYVGQRRGVSIAATEKRGIGYAIATDFNENESAELVASIR